MKIYRTHTAESLKTDTVRIVDHRLAKVASAFTRGFVQVRFGGESVCTDAKETIYLPANLEALSPDAGLRAWGYTNHEMGHIEVERQLTEWRSSRLRVRCSEAIYRAIPASIRDQGIEPRSRVELTTEFLERLPERGRAIAGVLCPDPMRERLAAIAAAGQLKCLVNAIEDPRMEAQVGRRWAGAAKNIQFIRDESLVSWEARALEAIAKGEDGFFVFSVAIVFRLSKQPTAHFGRKVCRQLAQVEDLLSLFETEGNWKESWGFFDSVNVALAMIGRIFDPSELRPMEPEALPTTFGSTEKGEADGLGEVIEMPDDDTTEGEDDDTTEGEDDDTTEGEGDDTTEGEGDDTTEGEGDDTTEGEGDDTTEGEGGDTTEGEGDDTTEGEGGETSEEGQEATPSDEPGEGPSEDGEGQEGGVPAEETGDTDDVEAPGSKCSTLEPGMVVRNKSTGQKARIVSVNPDGSINVEVFA